MNFIFYLFILHSSNFIYCLNQQKQPDKAEADNLKCCRSQETLFEVKALLLPCSSPGNKTRLQLPIRPSNSSCRLGFKRQTTSGVCIEKIQCEKKISLTIKVKNKGITNVKTQYIIIDHVYDSVTGKKQRLLFPYVVKIKQNPVLQVYPLTYEHLVNSEATETVYNDKSPGYIGCNTDPNNNPTCKIVKYKNEVIPYSTGFCCSCDPIKNALYQSKVCDNITALLPDRCFYKTEKPSIVPLNNHKFTTTGGKVQAEVHVIKAKRNVSNNGNNLADDRTNTKFIEREKPNAFFKQSKSEPKLSAAKFPHNAQKQHTAKYQIRGGQDCSKTVIPAELSTDPDNFHESTHCLEFSDLWYSVYSISEPGITHSLNLQIFEKHDSDSGYHWKEITGGKPITVGTKTKYAYPFEKNLFVAYSAENLSDLSFSLNPDYQRILIPDGKNLDESLYSELRTGPGSYLVLPKEKIDRSGKKCNVAGVGYEAFVKQPHRCENPRGTCLKHQPKHYYKEDVDAILKGKKGRYFLQFFAALPENPISVANCGKRNIPLENQTLNAYYTGYFTTTLFMEFKADNNIVLRSDKLAMITEVYIDGSSGLRLEIVAKVTNAGLISSIFYVALGECPTNIISSLNNIESKPVLIAPQHQHVFSLNLQTKLPKKSIYCTLQAINLKNEIVAMRRIRIEGFDRCICIWYCMCACLIKDGGLKCKPLTIDRYRAAGFQGGFPMSLHVVQYTFLDDMVSMMLYIILFLCLILLVLGIIKALLGLFLNVRIGIWGLDLILDLPKNINHYYERNIKHRKVRYDSNGWPIHPDTKKRVRNIGMPTEFTLNVIFFFIFPFAVCFAMLKRIFTSTYQRRTYEDYTYDESYEKDYNLYKFY